VRSTWQSFKTLGVDQAELWRPTLSQAGSVPSPDALTDALSFSTMNVIHRLSKLAAALKVVGLQLSQ
jgi:hypothetical protein